MPKPPRKTAPQKTVPQKTGPRKKPRKGDLNLPAWTFEPIGVVESCFKEKFGIPRQSGLVSGARGAIRLNRMDDLRAALKGFEGFSHLWVVFVFHDHGGLRWRPTIRPPRLGGARKVGVLASRSPHRPNPIGLSVLKIEKILPNHPEGPRIEVSGVDLLDGTPVLDIKPYVPYADALPDALGGWASEPIPRSTVSFSDKAEAQLSARAAISYPGAPADEGYANLKSLIVEMLEIDPRPASQRRRLPADSPQAQGTRYGFNLLEWDVKWEIRDEAFVVTEIAER